MYKQLIALTGFFFVFLLGYVPQTQAQRTQLIGTIMDAREKSPLIGATITLMSQKDSAQKFYTAADVEGKFVIDQLPYQNYLLKVSYIGYEDFTQAVVIDQPQTNLGNLYLAVGSRVLKEVEVVGQTPVAIQKGDTTELNASTFKTSKDATAEELVKKMPGVTVEEGTVKAQGENVGKVLIDGKEYFGEDAAIALKNLPAEIVDKVQVFDRGSEQSQFTGFDDGNTTKTLNIVTNKSNGVFGRIYGGYGTDERYQAGASINIFKGKTRLAIIGLSNNINQQNFAQQDLTGLTGQQAGGQGGGGFGGRGGGGRGGMQQAGAGFLVGNQPGITATHSLGLNYSSMWGKKIAVTGSYFFNATDNRTEQRISREYFLSGDDRQYYLQNSVSATKNENHRINFRLDYRIDSMNSLLLTPRISWQTNHAKSDLNAVTNEGPTNAPLSEAYNYNGRESQAFNAGNDLLYRRSFAKRGRTFSLNLNTQFSNRDWNNTLRALNTFFTPAGTVRDSIQQLSRRPVNSYTVGTALTYTEPLGKMSQLSLSYNFSLNNNWSERRTYNFNESQQRYTLLDTALSNTFDNDYTTHRAGIGYRLSKGKKLNLALTANFQYARLQGEQLFPVNDRITRSFNNLLPMAMLRYNFSDNANVRMFYRSFTNAPSVSQLQNVIDNTNTLVLTSGNPALRQEYGHMGVIRYSKNNPSRASSFFVVMHGSYTQNYIGNSTVIAERDTVVEEEVVLRRGSQFVRPVNLSGNHSLSTFMTYGIPVKKLKINLNSTTLLAWRRIPGLINGATNFADSYNLSQGVVISSNISDKIDFTLSSTGNYTIVQNSIRAELNNNYYYQVSSLRTNLIFWKGIVWQNELNHTWFTGLASGFDQNFLLWNMSIGKKILKGQQGEIKLSVFDLLKQNNSIARTVTEAYIEDVRTRVMSQYFMLTFTYQLRSFKKN